MPLIFAEILDKAGVPAGVFNLVNGHGPGVGAAMIEPPDIDMVSFTGSTRAGIDVAKPPRPPSSASVRNSASAMTSARNEPETRMPRNSIVRTSLPIARTSRSRTSSIGRPVPRLAGRDGHQRRREPA